MSNVSKLIYREINNLIPDLRKIKPLEKIDLKAYGFADIHLIVLESSQEEIVINLSHYSKVKRLLVANPSVEIVIYPGKNSAEVVIYKDPHFTYHLITREAVIYSSAYNHVNRLVYEWLRELRIWNCNKNGNISTLFLH